MNKTFAITSLLCLAFFFTIAQSNDTLPGPRVWLRADQSKLNATQWTDVTTFNHHATANTATEMPQASGTINYNPALTFDGVDDYFKIPFNLDGLVDFSVLAVFQSSDTTERGIWGSEQGVTRNVLLTTRRAMGPDTIIDVYGKNEKRTALNAVLQSWESASATPTGAYMALGSAGKTKGYKPFKGMLAEILVFDHALKFVEHRQFETYLAIKYGTGSTEGNLISSTGNTLWKIGENSAYGKNIAGLGRDDYFSLYQKQSASAYDSGLLVISAGPVAALNADNKAKLADQDFLLWGDNGLPLTLKRGVGVDSVLTTSQRKWLVTASGTINKLPLQVYVDIARFPVNALGYWLVIDRSGTGNFSADNLEYVSADNVVNGKAVYTVTWDKDGSGKDAFGFARAVELFAVVRKVSDPSCTDVTAGKVNIEMIAGKAPYRNTLSEPEAKLSRSWKQSEKISEQKELSKGTYQLTVEDDNGEEIIRHFTLTMPDALSITLGPDQKLLTGKDIVLDVSSQVSDTIPVSYRWENNFGFASTDKKITVTESGIYRVFVTKKKDGCVFTDDIAISGGAAQRVAVYPNLLSSGDPYNVSVSLNEPGNVLVKVFNPRGIQVGEMQGAGQTEFQFITSLKDSGMYLVVIQTAKGIESRKVIVY